MRTLSAFVSLLSMTLLLPGCPGLGCGGFSGGGDKVFTHDSEMLIECENGGYVMTLADGTREGHYSPDFVADDGPTGAKAFDIVTNPDATLQVLGRTWTFDDLNQTALDHADVSCTDLTTRTWWTATSSLPVVTAFGRPASGFATTAACETAKTAGMYPNNATCQEQLLFCPDGTGFYYSGDVVQMAAYSSSYGTVTGFGMSGTFTDRSFDTTWNQIDAGTVEDNTGLCR